MKILKTDFIFMSFLFVAIFSILSYREWNIYHRPNFLKDLLPEGSFPEPDLNFFWIYLSMALFIVGLNIYRFIVSGKKGER